MDSFDSLKREATKLERSLEDKVARYQQVRTNQELVLRKLIFPERVCTPFALHWLTLTHPLSFPTNQLTYQLTY